MPTHLVALLVVALLTRRTPHIKSACYAAHSLQTIWLPALVAN
jgi:hypothetical protein